MNRVSDKKGYPWFFVDVGRPWLNTWIVTLILSIVFILSLFVYARFSQDMSSDSVAGYTYAIVGSGFMLMATFLYTRSRRQRQRQIGQLNKSLNWHICFGVLAIVILFLHSFGNFNPRTGTYALEGMIALVISGFIGRIIDRMGPRQITKEVQRALNEYGDDRIEDISRNVQEIATHNSQNLRAFKPQEAARAYTYGKEAQVVTPDPVSLGGTALPSSWDIAYISLKETPQEVNRSNQQYRFVPDKKSELAAPGALIPGYKDQIKELKVVQHALQREQFYRALVRYWRFFHVILVMATLGLTIWHLVYAGQLLIPLLFKH